MEFGEEKRAVLTIKKRKLANSDGIALPNKTTKEELKEGDSYKYLGVIQARNKTPWNEGKSQNSTIEEW